MSDTNEIKYKRRKKGSRIIFGFTLLSMLFQTVLTFTLLLKSTEENKTLTKITTIIFFVYVIAFVLLTLVSIRSRRYEKESISMYKTSMKWFKRMVKLLLVVLSIMNIVSASKIDGFALVGAVVVLLINISLIALDIFISGVKYTIGRKYKKWKRKRAENNN